MSEPMTEDLKIDIVAGFFMFHLTDHPIDTAKRLIRLIRALDSYPIRDEKGRFVKNDKQ